MRSFSFPQPNSSSVLQVWIGKVLDFPGALSVVKWKRLAIQNGAALSSSHRISKNLNHSNILNLDCPLRNRYWISNSFHYIQSFSPTKKYCPHYTLSYTNQWKSCDFSDEYLILTYLPGLITHRIMDSLRVSPSAPNYIVYTAKVNCLKTNKFNILPWFTFLICSLAPSHTLFILTHLILWMKVCGCMPCCDYLSCLMYKLNSM